MTVSGSDTDGGRLAQRITMLRSCGAASEDMEALLAYTSTPYAAAAAVARWPFPDEPHVAAWQEYADDAQRLGAFDALARRFVQLRFPVRAGMSQEDAYRSATRRGQFTAADPFAPGVVLEDPAGLDVQIHPSVSGRIPVLIPSTRSDFVTLVQAFTERNEPVPVPDSMGACFVNGLNNWSRVNDHRRHWREAQGEAATDEAWAEEFKRLAAQKPLYQDRFIILSTGPYSAVPPERAGLPEREWLRQSLAIRREHECVHYLTYRIAGLIRSNALDELIADFAGLVAATGRYSSRLALRFLGLHEAPDGHPGAAWQIPSDSRLLIYRGQLGDAALHVIATVCVLAARRLERCAEEWGHRLRDVGPLARVVVALSASTIEEIAAGLVPAPSAPPSGGQ